jgi:hypothetical protein
MHITSLLAHSLCTSQKLFLGLPGLGIRFYLHSEVQFGGRHITKAHKVDAYYWKANSLACRSNVNVSQATGLALIHQYMLFLLATSKSYW